MPDKRTDIVLGVVYNTGKDKVLVARRKLHSHLGGLWEFPGGKVRTGENALQALKRELFEEINIDSGSCSPLISFDYDYPDKSLRFSVWKVHDWAGGLMGGEGQETQWVEISSLTLRDFPAANKGIIAACKLPALYLITPDLDSYAQAFVSELREYLAAGVKLVQFRSKNSNNCKPAVIKVTGACRSQGADLLVNSTPEFAMEVGASGVHLTSKRLLELTGRPLPAESWVGASCHNLQELNHAVETDLDFCVLSQVGKSGGKSGYSLGWDRFSDMIRNIPIPVYALGGMKLSDLTIARQHGAQGIALISDVWDRQDSAARLTRTLTGVDL